MSSRLCFLAILVLKKQSKNTVCINLNKTQLGVESYITIKLQHFYENFNNKKPVPEVNRKKYFAIFLNIIF